MSSDLYKHIDISNTKKRESRERAKQATNESLYWRGLKPGAGSTDDRDHSRQDHLLQKRTTMTRWPLTYKTSTRIPAKIIQKSNQKVTLSVVTVEVVQCVALVKGKRGGYYHFSGGAAHPALPPAGPDTAGAGWWCYGSIAPPPRCPEPVLLFSGGCDTLTPPPPQRNQHYLKQAQTKKLQPCSSETFFFRFLFISLACTSEAIHAQQHTCMHQ